MPEVVVHFYTTDVRVFYATMEQGSEKQHEASWDIRYAPKVKDDVIRFISGELHCAGDGIQVSVSVGAILADTGFQYKEDDLEELLSDSDAVESLYQGARNAARILVSLAEGSCDVPETAPEGAIDALNFEPGDSPEGITESAPEDTDQTV